MAFDPNTIGLGAATASSAAPSPLAAEAAALPAGPSDAPGIESSPAGLGDMTASAQNYADKARTAFDAGPSKGFDPNSAVGLAATGQKPMAAVIQGVSDAASASGKMAQFVSNRENVKNLIQDMRDSGVDDNITNSFESAVGDGSDKDAILTAWKTAAPAIKSAKIQNNINKLMSDEQVQAVLKTTAGQVEQVQNDPSLSDADKASAIAKIQAAAKDGFTSTLVSRASDLGINLDNDTLDAMKKIADMVVGKPKNKSASAAAKGQQTWYQLLKSNSSMGAAALFDNVTTAMQNPTIKQYFDAGQDPQLAAKFGGVQSIDKVNDQYLNDLTSKAMRAEASGSTPSDIILVKDSKGQTMPIIRQGSSEGANLLSPLYGILNAYLRTKTGSGTVSRANLLNYANELGLGELVKFELQQIGTKTDSDIDAEGLSKLLTEAYNNKNRYVNIGQLFADLHNNASQIMNSVNGLSTYKNGVDGDMDTRIDQYISKVGTSYNNFMQQTVPGMQLATGGSSGQVNKNMVTSPKSPYISMVGMSEAGITGANKVLLDAIYGPDGDVKPELVAAAEGKGIIGGSESGQKLQQEWLDGKQSFTEEQARLESTGETTGVSNAIENLLKAKDKTGQALFDKPVSKMTIEEKSRVMGILTAAGMQDVGKYLLTGQAVGNELKGLGQLVMDGITTKGNGTPDLGFGKSGTGVRPVTGLSSEELAKWVADPANEGKYYKLSNGTLTKVQHGKLAQVGGAK